MGVDEGNLQVIDVDVCVCVCVFFPFILDRGVLCSLFS